MGSIANDPLVPARGKAAGAAAPRKRRRAPKNPFAKPKKRPKTSQSLSTAKKGPPTFKVWTEILIQIFELIDHPITAVCFSLVNRKCRDIFLERYKTQFPDMWRSWEHCPALKLSSFMHKDGLTFKLSYLLKDVFGKNFFYDSWNDRYVDVADVEDRMEEHLEDGQMVMAEFREKLEKMREDREERRKDEREDREQRRIDKRELLRYEDGYNSDEYVDSSDDEEATSDNGSDNMDLDIRPGNEWKYVGTI